jgi:hypothetical protein
MSLGRGEGMPDVAFCVGVGRVADEPIGLVLGGWEPREEVCLGDGLTVDGDAFIRGEVSSGDVDVEAFEGADERASPCVGFVDAVFRAEFSATAQVVHDGCGAGIWRVELAQVVHLLSPHLTIAITPCYSLHLTTTGER